MTIVNGYITLAQLKAVVYPADDNVAASTANDTKLELIVEAACRAVDKYCGTTFYGVPETRYYTPEDNYFLDIDHITGTPTIATDEDGDGTYETTWSASDFSMWPYNSVANGKPYTAIELTPNTTKVFQVCARKSVRIYGTYGYCATTADCPEPVQQAVLIWANRLWERKNIPFGVAGNPTLGQPLIRIPSPLADGDIKELLAPYVRWY